MNDHAKLLDPIEGEPELEAILRDPWIRDLAQNAAVVTLYRTIEQKADNPDASMLEIIMDVDGDISGAVAEAYSISTTLALHSILLKVPGAVEHLRTELLKMQEKFKDTFSGPEFKGDMVNGLVDAYEVSLLDYANSLSTDNPDRA